MGLDSKSTTKRVLCVWLPEWPLQRLRCMQPGLEQRPVVLSQEGRRGAQVAFCSPSAAGLGIRPGMPMAEAGALLEGSQRRFRGRTPHQEAHDPQADLLALRELAEWCQRFSPVVGVEEGEMPDSLLLDVTGCGHLHGGDAELAAQVVRQFRERSLRVRAAVADTLGAAWAVARHGRRSEVQVVPPGRQEESLRELPVDALRLPLRIVQSMRDLGLDLIGQLLELPRKSLPSRFGRETIRRLDQALGVLPEPLIPIRRPEPIEAEWEFEPPTNHRPAMEFAFRTLVGQILQKASGRQESVHRLTLHLFAPRGSDTKISVGLLRPSLAPEHWIEMIRLRLEQARLSAEVSRIRVRVVATAPLGARQQELFDGGSLHEEESQKSLAHLIDRLSHRLGESCVLRPRLCADAQPELASRFEPILAVEGGAIGRKEPRPPQKQHEPPREWGDGSGRMCRPLRLLEEPAAVNVTTVFPEGPPVRLRWFQNDAQVVRCWGPERIETGWWRGDEIQRDYYRVELDEGCRLWLFRDLRTGRWFLHGSFE